MTKNTMNAIYTALTNIDFENKAEVMAEIEKELNRGAAEKAEKAAEYEAAWDAVAEGLKVVGTPVSVADLFAEIEGNLPEGFTKNRLSYGLTHYWADRVVKTVGKVNLYTIAV